MTFVVLVAGVLAVVLGQRGLRSARDFALGGVRGTRWGIALGRMRTA